MCCGEANEMRDTVPLVNPPGTRIAVFVAAGAGALLALTGLLWARYGGAVFHEMLLAGIALCF
jgi:hypothetical protein